MKALILYRTYYGNTKIVAETIAHELTGLGYETTVQDLRGRLPNLESFTCAVVGAPTRMARVTRKALRVLRKLGRRGFGVKPVAIFDTYGPVPTGSEELEKAKRWIWPGAAGIMEKTAKDRGLNVFAKTLRCEVAGLKGPLAEHEKEKASVFAREFATGSSRT
ncbi:MAG TPA: flavodoxin domain-containing protein [Spirochaetia bacterium]|nr:flavodoxin domain-containing protein [Spirochaetia bacterium]